MGNMRIAATILAVALQVIMFGLPTGARAANTFGVDLFAAAVTNDTTFIIVGDRGKIFISENAGATFAPVESKTLASLAAVCFPSASQGWIVGQGGVVLHSADGGKSWSAQNSGVTRYLMDVDFVDDMHGCAVGANSTVIVTSDGGKTWTPSTFTITKDVGGEYNLFAVKLLGPQSLCMTGDMGRVFLSADFGKTWSEAQTPLYDQTTGEGRTLYAIDAYAATLFAIGIDGTLITSKDAGKTWTEAESGKKEPDYFCLALTPSFGLAVGSGGNVLQSEDGGASWRTVRVPEKIYRAWLCGVALKQSSKGDVVGLVVGQYGTLGIVKNATLTWR
ncbi:MAG: YCF48-related protein [Syntrophaceae bacterium]